MLQVENVFLQSGHHQSGKARMAKRKFEVKEGDLLTLLNVYRFESKFTSAFLLYVVHCTHPSSVSKISAYI
jgi:ATP-dependent RNA helicase DDX35